jgi:hypothetical protein
MSKSESSRAWVRKRLQMHRSIESYNVKQQDLLQMQSS